MYTHVHPADGHMLRQLADSYDPPTAKRIKTWAVFEMLKLCHMIAGPISSRYARTAAEESTLVSHQAVIKPSGRRQG